MLMTPLLCIMSLYFLVITFYFLFSQPLREEVPTADDVKITVEHMLDEDNALATAFDSKADVEDAMTHNDAVALVAQLVDGAADPVTNPLRFELDNVASRLEALEDVVSRSMNFRFYPDLNPGPPITSSPQG